MNHGHDSISHRPNSHSVRRIVLPSGRKIEVVRPKTDSVPEPEALHVCHRCSSELVQPVGWRPSTSGAWELTLECPNCRSRTEGVYDPGQIEAFENHLDEGLEDLLSDLRQLTRSNMSEEIDRFVEALEADWILPEDFAPRA